MGIRYRRRQIVEDSSLNHRPLISQEVIGSGTMISFIVLQTLLYVAYRITVSTHTHHYLLIYNELLIKVLKYFFLLFNLLQFFH